jgi:hypothetical protein
VPELALQLHIRKLLRRHLFCTKELLSTGVCDPAMYLQTAGLLNSVKFYLKGLSHEIDFKNVDENGQILALLRAAAGF